MAVSDRRKRQREAKRARKAAQMARPGRKSVYALKKQGVYPLNSPYCTIWAEYA